jgi:hypothetical protein
MHTHDVIRILKAAEQELRARGVRSLALFGSTARGEARPDSDVDVLVDLDMSRHPTLVDVSAVRLLLEDQLGCRTDMAIRDGLRPAYQASIEADAIRVF